MKNFFSLSKFKSSRTFAILLGLSATLWFLIRVIPKPSRANYPCMQAAAPLMSTFVIYLLGISTSVFSFRKFKTSVKSAKYVIATVFLALSFLSFSLLILNDSEISIANTLFGVDETFPINSNDPIGVAQGMFPGRVVWVHDPQATNENYDPNNAGNDWWYSDNNANEMVIKNMLNTGIKEYAGKDDIAQAWDTIFKAFNAAHGRGSNGYVEGERITIKLNLTNQCCTAADRMDATPQLVNALLYELIENAGVPAGAIIVGDPYREFRFEYKQLVKSKFPGVKFVDGKGGDGIFKTTPSSTEALIFSDKQFKSTLPSNYLTSTYFINMPCLKTHDVGGITLIAKNHQGSYLAKGNDPTSQSASLMHYSLPKENPGIGKYRHTVDYMGHQDTGGKGLIYIIDGIWAGENWEGLIKKFKSDPFNDDYPNSIFIGQDPVALESVCFDVLFQEYSVDDTKENYPILYKEEVADYLSQCASSDYWPADIVYDPEGDGSPLTSLGVFEHWNNPADRQYSRDLGTGNGIELNYYLLESPTSTKYTLRNTITASPNPFSEYTVFSHSGNISECSKLAIYNMKGQCITQLDFDNSTEIFWNGTDGSGKILENGIYVYTLYDMRKEVKSSGKIAINR